MAVTVEDGRITQVEADPDNVSSRGFICTKGPNMAGVVYDPERVLYPMKRTGGPGEFTRCSWDEALDDISARLSSIKDEWGGEAIGAYVGNPAAFAGMQYDWVLSFLRSLGSTQNFTPSAADISAVCFATEAVIGPGFPIPDLPHCDYLLIVGANPLESHTSLLHAPRVREDLDAIADRGAVVVVDPRATKTAKRYTHQPIQPNSDVYFMAGLLKTVFDESLVDEEFIAADVAGADRLAAALGEFSLEKCAGECGIPIADIQRIARDFAGHERAACYSRLGISRASYGALTNVFLLALNIVTGKFGRKGCSFMGLNPFIPEGFSNRGAENSHGKQRTRTGNLPAVGGHLPTTVMADEILHPGEDHLRALLVSAGNPVLSFPNGTRLEEALQTLDLLVGLDLYINETNQYADYILPATTFFERADVPVFSITTMPRPAMHYTPAVIEPLGESREEQHVFMEIAKRMGLPNPMAMTLLPEELWEEHRDSDQLSLLDRAMRAGMFGDQFGERPGGLSIDLLRQHPHGLKIEDFDAYPEWRRHARHPEGKLELWNDTIAGEIRRLRQEGLRLKPDEGQLRLFGRRSVRNINSWMHNIGDLVKGDAGSPALFMHPDDASARDIEDGQLVEVAGKYRAVNCRVKLTSDVVPGSVCYPHGWGHGGAANWSTANQTRGVNINDIISSDVEDLDPMTGSPLMDGFPVTVSAA
jgi:formate dehydrogenase